MPEASLPIIFATSFAVGFSGAITPGPLLVYSIREAIKRGFAAGPLVVLGHALLEGGLATSIIGVLGGALGFLHGPYPVGPGVV